MSDIVNKLVADLKWRLSGAGKKHRPKAKEVQSWGAMVIPRAVPWLVWLSYTIFVTVGSETYFWLRIEEFPGYIIGGPVGIVLAGLLVSFVTRKINTSFALKAYQGLLDSKERFTLVEYSRYLRRQISRAKEDETLGGEAEVARLKELDIKLRQLLKAGAGKEGTTIASDLSEEAELAEALVETYGELLSDPLEKLDSRLPQELLASIEALEQEEARRKELPTEDV